MKWEGNCQTIFSGRLGLHVHAGVIKHDYFGRKGARGGYQTPLTYIPDEEDWALANLIKETKKEARLKTLEELEKIVEKRIKFHETKMEGYRTSLLLERRDEDAWMLSKIKELKEKEI